MQVVISVLMLVGLGGMSYSTYLMLAQPLITPIEIYLICWFALILGGSINTVVERRKKDNTPERTLSIGKNSNSQSALH